MAVPATVWSSAAYPRDQSYPIRWEFGRGVEDLGTDADRTCSRSGAARATSSRWPTARGHRAVGIDFSDTAVAKAQARGLRAYLRRVRRARATRRPRRMRFDAVALFQVIEHLADPGRALRRRSPHGLRPWRAPLDLLSGSRVASPGSFESSRPARAISGTIRLTTSCAGLLPALRAIVGASRLARSRKPWRSPSPGSPPARTSGLLEPSTMASSIVRSAAA